MADNLIAQQANYADCLMICRRARNWTFAILLLVLLGQLALFFVARYTDYFIPSTSAATQPVQSHKFQLMVYVISLCGYFAIGTAIVQSIIMLLVTLVMVVARLVGVAKVTSAFIWSIVLLVMLFPWQAFLNNSSMTFDNFKVPGVVYHWHELMHNAKFDVRNADGAILWPQASLSWARFVGFPVLAVLILLTIHLKSSRAIWEALGGSVNGESSLAEETLDTKTEPPATL